MRLPVLTTHHSVTAIGLAITLKFVSAVNYATPLFDKILYTWLGLHLVLDLVITCTLTVTLIRQRAKASKRTQWIVSRIVMYVAPSTRR